MLPSLLAAAGLVQSALLAGLPQAPSVYDPLHNPHAALARRDEVLRALLVNQQITQHQYDVASMQRHGGTCVIDYVPRPRHA